MKNKKLWQFLIQAGISILTALATILGVSACMLS